MRISANDDNNLNNMKILLISILVIVQMGKSLIWASREPGELTMPAEAIMALANSTQANYSTNNTHQQHHHQSAVFEDSPPSMSNGVDFFESLAAEKPTHLEYLKNFRFFINLIIIN